MPLVIPPFVQYQAPLVPLRGLWNTPPAEGDRFVSAEIDWAITTGPGLAVQFALSGNSPVAFTQIVAMQVDNTHNAADCQFLYPDSGYTLVVPAYCQGTFPVFTNALMFYVSSVTAVPGDRTVFQVLNSMPPPVAVQESTEQENNGIAGIILNVVGNTQIIPPGINGTLELISGSIAGTGDTGAAQLNLIDGTGKILWIVNATSSTTLAPLYFNAGPMSVGFVDGVALNVSTTDLTGGLAIFNLYYRIP